MTAADDAAKAVMRAYADTLQPPPVADVIARAERTRDAPHPPSTSGLRSRRRLVLGAASVAVAVTVVAIAVDQLPDRGASTAIRPTASPSASTPVAIMAPGCPPGLPVLDGPRTIEGLLAKPITVKAGQQLTLTALIQAPQSDRRILSFRIYLLPHDAFYKRVGRQPQPADLWLAAEAVSQSADLRLAPGQHRVFPVLQIPTGLVPGTYDMVGYGTYPSPSVCAVTNPAHSTDVGSEEGVLGRVVVIH